MLETKNLVNELLVEVFNNILAIEERALKDKGVRLSMTEIHVLEAIRNSETPTMTNVSTKLRVTIGTLTTSVATLVRKGYVIRERGKDDKRIVYLSLTNLAIEALKIHDEFHDDMIESVCKDLKIDEDEVLIKSLKRIKEYFKKQY